MNRLIRMLVLAGALALAGGVALSPSALAQDGGLVLEETAGGWVVSGSLTIDGVTYTAADVEVHADTYVNAPWDLAPLPDAVFDVVHRFAKATNPIPEPAGE